MIKKIHICGIYGCGKTTLAEKLSKLLNLPHYSLDDIKYEVKYTQIRPLNERLMKLSEICNSEKWITEGSWSDYAQEAFKNSDLIIFMDIPIHICSYRIFKRFIKRKRGKNDNFMEMIKLIRQVYRYHKSKEPISLYVHKQILNVYNFKSVIVKNNAQIGKLINKLIFLNKN